MLGKCEMRWNVVDVEEVIRVTVQSDTACERADGASDSKKPAFPQSFKHFWFLEHLLHSQ